jgi:hypothetical protein
MPPPLNRGDNMLKCECGFKTRNRRRMARHKRKCKVEQKEKTFNELRAEAKEKGIEGYGRMNKQQLLESLGGG